MDDDQDLLDSGSGELYTPGVDDDDTFFGEEPVLSYKEADYLILSRAQLAAEQQKDIDKITEVLGVHPHQVRILLMHFEWDAERLLTVFFERGKEQVYKEAGVRDPEKKNAQPSGRFLCSGCYEDCDQNSSTALQCNHRFCNSCWSTYVTMKIKDGQSRRIHCMGYKCNVIFDETLIADFVDRKTYGKYVQNLLDSFVEDNARMKWCPSVPHCGHAVRAREGAGLTIDVRCVCNHNFCFGCLNEAHSPASCDMKKGWITKSQSDGETVTYLLANTKECPKCHKQIEKDGGCNLVTCRCGQHFCWVCGAPTGIAHTWTSIEGHTCGRWKPELSGAIDDAKAQLKRYGFYWERYRASDDMKKIKDKLKVQLQEKEMKLLERISAYETKWLLKGFAQLLECRRILAHSYVFAFYMFGKEMPFSSRIDPVKNSLHKTLFEDYQEQLEAVTEQLNKYLLTPAADILQQSKILSDVMNTAVLADRRCKGLFDIIIADILAVSDYGFQIAHYTPQLDNAGGGRMHLKLSSDYTRAKSKSDNSTTVAAASSSSSSSTIVRELAADTKDSKKEDTKVKK